MKKLLPFSLVLFLFVSLLCSTVAAAAETVFTSRAAFNDEVSRLGGEGVRFVTSPVTEYLPATALTLGAFGLTYVFDRDIRSKVRGVKSNGLGRAADVGSFIGNPYIQLGSAAVVYGAGALTDSPRVQRVGAELGEALILTDAAGFVLKTAIGRGRPGTGDDRSSYRPFGFKSDYDSLPSMHTASSFAVAHVMASETESFSGKCAWYVAATFVGFSRLYQEEHWASDIIIGAALGELAGRAVTNYRAEEKGRVRVVPAVSQQGAPMLALQGDF